MSELPKIIVSAMGGAMIGALITSATTPYHPKIVVDPAFPVPRVAIVPPTPPVIHIPAVYDGCTSCSPTARKLAWSIDNEPQRWAIDEFTVSRNDGLVIWTSNGAAHVSAGHNSVGKGWDPSDEDQNLVWRAYQRLAAKRAAQ